MACFTPESPRLHALIGDAVLDLPAAIVLQLEQVLSHSRHEGMAAAFVERLARANYPLAADGTLWDEPGVPLERNETLAQVSRSLEGLATVLHLLTAALAHRSVGDAPLGEHMLRGLLLSGRELVDSARDALHAGR